MQIASDTGHDVDHVRFGRRQNQGVAIFLQSGDQIVESLQLQIRQETNKKIQLWIEYVSGGEIGWCHVTHINNHRNDVRIKCGCLADAGFEIFHGSEN